MINGIEAICRKLFAGIVIIAGTGLGDIASIMILGTPITDPAIKLVVVAMAWQIWDNVIVPIVEDVRPKRTASQIASDGSMKLIG